jgi:2-oxoglutarate ferredoxin oxidoreductase subunit beta
MGTTQMKQVFGMPEAMKAEGRFYCPGCGHGIVHRLVSELVDEFGVRERTVGIAPVGCSVFADLYWNFDVVSAAHGRAPAVATGITRANPNVVCVSYQGDGDLAAIGTAETIHAANRGESFVTVFVNNAIYGMTGGQMAPTTLIGQKSTTCQLGRDPAIMGYPIRVCELLQTLGGVAFLARGVVDSPKNVLTVKKYLKKAFQYAIDKKGYTLVEIVSPCPTNWGMTPPEAMDWLQNNMLDYFKPGVYRDIGEEATVEVEPGN